MSALRTRLAALKRPAFTLGGALLATAFLSAPAWAWCPALQLVATQQSTVQAGGTINLTVTPGDSQTTKVPIYLDTSPGADSNQIGTCTASGKTLENCTVTVPANTAPGTYYLGGIEQNSYGQDVGEKSGCTGPKINVTGPVNQLPEVPYPVVLPGAILAVGLPLMLRRRRQRSI